MIHKIHIGANLPSVQAGTPYQIIGYAQTRSTTSRTSTSRGQSKLRHLPHRRPGRLLDDPPNPHTCTSCHDLTAFVDPPPAGMTLHSGGPQANDNACTSCHPASGGLAGIYDVHLTPLHDPASPTSP